MIMQHSGIAVLPRRAIYLLSDKAYVPVKNVPFDDVQNRDFGNASETTLAS